MQRGVYFGISAGVALAGAGLVAIAPVTRPLPDVQVPVIELSSDSTPKIDEQYLQWWQIVSGDSAAPPSLNELNGLDLSSDLLNPDSDTPAPLTLRPNESFLPETPAPPA